MNTEKYVRLAKNFYIVTTIIGALQIMISLIINFFIIPEPHFPFNGYTFIWTLILLLFPINGISIEKNYNAYIHPIESHTSKNKYEASPKANLLCSFITSNPLYPFLFFSLFLLSPKDSSPFFFLGYTFGLAYPFLILSHIFFIIVLIKIKDYEVKNGESVKNQNTKGWYFIQEWKKNKDQKNVEKQLKKAKTLLRKTGDILFVTYYYELKNHSIPDIIDLIKIPCDKERLVNAKKIFKNNLQLIVLKLIVDNPHSPLTDELKKKAQKIVQGK